MVLYQSTVEQIMEYYMHMTKCNLYERTMRVQMT